MRAFILAEVHAAQIDIDITNTNWTGPQGRTLMDQILQRTLRIYGE